MSKSRGHSKDNIFERRIYVPQRVRGDTNYCSAAVARRNAVREPGAGRRFASSRNEITREILLIVW